MRKSLIGAVSAALVAVPLSVLTQVASPAEAAPSQSYTWKNVEIGGGGYTPGIVFSEAEKDLIYARTDIGGLYRWNASTSRWVPLLDWVGQNNWGYNGVVSVAPDPTNANKVYAAVGMYTNDWDPNNGAIIRSSDKGATWATTALPFKLGGNMPGRGMGERLSVDPLKPSTLYFGAPSGKGLWKSTDSGVTWAQVTNFPNVGNYVYAPGDAYGGDIQGVNWVTFDPRTGNSSTGSQNIYVGVADLQNTIYKSSDAGATWTRVAGQPTGYIANKGKLDTTNGNLYITTADSGGPYDGAAGAVWKYATATGTWTDVTPPPFSDAHYYGFNGLTLDKSAPGTLVVATQVSWWPDAQFWRSTDSGATWKPLWEWAGYPSRTFHYTLDITTVPWLSLGVTATAPEVSPKLGWMNDAVAIDPYNSNRMLYGTGMTIYGTTNLGDWSTGGTVNLKPYILGLEETAALDLISPPSGAPLISGLGDIGGFVHSSLTTVPTKPFTAPYFTSTTSLDFAESNPSVIVRVGNFTASDRPNDKHIGFSTDGGANWFQGADPGTVNSGGTVAAAADASGFVWAPGDSGAAVVYSSGYGYNWSQSSGVPANATIESDRVNAKKFYAYSAGGFYVSTNSGATFTKTAATGLPTTGVKFHAVFGKEGDIWLAGGSATSLPQGLWHSTDSGASFTKVSNVSAAINIGYGKAATGSTYPALYLAGTVDGVSGAYRSDDAGANWIRINDDTHQYGNWGEAITGDPRVYGRVYMGTNGRGVLYADPSGSTPTTTTTTTTTTTRPTTTTTTTVPTTTTTTTRPTTTTTTTVPTTTTTTTRPTTTTTTTVPTTTTTTTRPTTTTTTTTTRPTTTTTTTTTTRPTTTTTTGGGTAKTCSATYSVVGSWPGGFQGEVKVTAGSAAIAGWSVNWTFANGQVVSQAWGGKLTQSGSAVTVTNEAWNGALSAGGQSTTGFLASWNSSNTVPTVTCTAS